MCVAGLYDKCLAAAHCQILLSICIQEFVIITNITVITNIIITKITNIIITVITNITLMLKIISKLCS